MKTTRDSTVTPVKITTTLYLFGNYVNDTLQFLPQEEGRVRYDSSKTSLVYDYFLKDHLGNVRMILTDETDTSFYPPASLETANLASERLFYSKVDSGRVDKSTVTGYPADTYTNPNNFIQKLNGNGVKVGTGIVLKVMAGDKFNLRVSSWWSSGNTPGTPVNPLNDVVAALAGSVGNIPGKPSSTELLNSGVLPPNATNFLNGESGWVTSRPKAFINWILFDERFNYVASSSGFEQVGTSGVFTTHTRSNLTLNKSGYLYVYVSNETPNIDVFFDNLQVTHIRGPLTEETHYYPFGLTMGGVSSSALNFGQPDSKSKFNGYEQQRKEFTDGSGLEWYDYKHRFYDNQIGRFFCLDTKASDYPYYSPYQFAGNQVSVAIDLDGEEPKYMIDGNGHLTNPMKSLLHAAFGYTMSSLNNTNWKPSDIQFADAITLFRTVSYNRYLSSNTDSYWAELIAHEQNHRNEIGNDAVGALSWYTNYSVGYVGAGFSYERDPAEVRAYANGLGPDSRMNKLINFGGGVALKVLQGNYDDNAKSETLNFIGLVFNLSEQTQTLNSMQDKLNNFKGNDKAKHRLERRIGRAEKQVNDLTQQVQQAITDDVVNTLKDVNKNKKKSNE